MKEFTSFQAAKYIGVKYGRLREWIDREYIKPDYKAQGQGDKSLFSSSKLYLMGLFSYLVDRGLFTREEAGQRVTDVEKYWQTCGEEISESNSAYVTFFRRSGGPLVISETGHRTIFPYMHILSDDCLEKPMRSILRQPSIKRTSWSKDDDFDDVVIVNFGKIIKQIKSRLEE